MPGNLVASGDSSETSSPAWMDRGHTVLLFFNDSFPPAHVLSRCAARADVVHVCQNLHAYESQVANRYTVATVAAASDSGFAGPASSSTRSRGGASTEGAALARPAPVPCWRRPGHTQHAPPKARPARSCCVAEGWRSFVRPDVEQVMHEAAGLAIFSPRSADRSCVALLKNLLSTFDLTICNPRNSPTHRAGAALDLVIATPGLVHDIQVHNFEDCRCNDVLCGPLLGSDHFAISIVLNKLSVTLPTKPARVLMHCTMNF